MMTRLCPPCVFLTPLYVPIISLYTLQMSAMDCLDATADGSVEHIQGQMSSVMTVLWKTAFGFQTHISHRTNQLWFYFILKLNLFIFMHSSLKWKVKHICLAIGRNKHSTFFFFVLYFYSNFTVCTDVLKCLHTADYYYTYPLCCHWSVNAEIMIIVCLSVYLSIKSKFSLSQAKFLAFHNNPLAVNKSAITKYHSKYWIYTFLYLFRKMLF